MSNEATVQYGESASDTATLLLAAAEDLDLPVHVVRTTLGAFLVPEDVAKKAKVDYEIDPEPEYATIRPDPKLVDPDVADDRMGTEPRPIPGTEPADQPEAEKAPAKKAARKAPAKKAAKRAPAKKVAAKKSATKTTGK